MIALLCAEVALAHGGEDHGEPPPTVSASQDARIAAWSAEYEAVLRLPYAPPGERTDGTLLLADFDTSAPVATGKASLSLTGPGPVQASIAAGATPGVWPFHVAFPADGTYSGGLSVDSDRVDLLGIPAFTRAAPPAPSAGYGSGTLALGVGIGALAGAAVGWLARSRRTALVLVAIGLGTTLRALAHGGADHEPSAMPASGALVVPLESQFLLGVRTARVRAGPFHEEIRTFGVTVPRPGGGAEIHAPVTGVLALPEAGIVPGQAIRAGDPLASIAESLGGAERFSVVTGRSEGLVRVAEARKQLAIADRDAERAQALGAVLSERERLERQQALTVAREALAQAESAAASIGSRSPTTVLRSPITGRVSAMLARPGDVVTPGEPLFRVVADEGLWVEVRAPEAQGGRLELGATAVVVADARPDAPLTAVVLDPGSEADPATGTLRVTLALDQVEGWLKPGMAVTAAIVDGSTREALVVPDSAVVDSAGETLVFLKTGPESFEVRPVRIGARSGEDREVLQGLSGGERVVTEGTYVLRSLAGR